MKRLPALYAVADAAFGDPTVVAGRLFRAGVRILQVRSKGASSRDLFGQSIRIVEDAPDDAVVIVNDRPDIARLCGASGVHLGQDDLPPSAARSILSGEKVVGISTHDRTQALAAAVERVDYIAVGPIFESRTKSGHAPVLGLDGLAEICVTVSTPVVAIGGIRLEHLDDVFAAGASSVAVISDLIGHEEGIESRTRRFLDKLEAMNL